MIDELTSLLDNKYYNSITKKFAPPANSDINTETGFSNALKQAHKLLKCAQGTKDDIEHALAHIRPLYQN